MGATEVTSSARLATTMYPKSPEQELWHWLKQHGPRPWASIASMAQYLGADIDQVPITWIDSEEFGKAASWGYSEGTPREHRKWGIAVSLAADSQCRQKLT